MVKKIIALIILLVIFSQTNVFAIEDITLETNLEKIRADMDTVTIKGVAEKNEHISVKAIGEEGNIIYFKAVISDNEGNYTDSFKVADDNTGKMTIVVGSGKNVASKDIEVYQYVSKPKPKPEPKPEPKSKPKSRPKLKPEAISQLQAQKDGSVKVTVEKPKVDENTREARALITLEALENALEKTKPNENGKQRIQVEIPAVDKAKGYQLNLPTEILKSRGKTEMEIRTGIGNMALPGNMLDSNDVGGSDDISLHFGLSDKGRLPSDIREEIGDKPIIEISLECHGEVTSWNNPNAPVRISIPYVPTEEELENPEKIVVWYIDGEGNITPVPNGRYDEETGSVVFEVTHFSTYAVAYVEKTFNDLEAYSWAKNQIEALAAKGIINGTSENTYSPSANITRADFLTLLIRTLELQADFEDNFEDINRNDYYYKAVGIAKALGITSGTGDNRFNPKENITRQDMMVLATRAMLIKSDIEKADTSYLESFADNELVSIYAKESISTLIKEGIVQGSKGVINPLGKTIRAEAAVIIYRIYNKLLVN